MIKFALFTLSSFLVMSSAFAGVVTCKAVLAPDSTSTQNPPEVDLTMDYEPSGTIIRTSVPVGWNTEIVDFTVVYSQYDPSSGLNMLVASNLTSTESSLMEITGDASQSTYLGYHTMLVGDRGVFAKLGKRVTYNIDCNL